MNNAKPVGDPRRWRSPRLIALLLAAGIAVAAHDSRAAAEACANPMARVVSAQGVVEVLRARDSRWQAAPLGTAVCHGDTVRVADRSRAALALNNEVVVRLDQRTAMTFAGAPQDSPSLLELCRGALHFITRFPKPLRVITPFLNASVEGTEFSVTDSDALRQVAVMEGSVSAVNTPDRTMPQTCEALPEAARAAGGGSALLTAGQTVSLVPGRPPAPTLLVRPTDAVQWALYYPPVIEYRDEVGGEGKDARFHTRRAGLLLQVGRVDEAARDIQQALALRGADADAYALQAIVAVARNDKDTAIAHARKAVELQPASPAAHIALSYALQAQFRIDDSLASATRAAHLDTASGIAWARVAELEMSTGDLKAALAAAQRATAAAPQLSRTQTILGFAHLTRIDTAKAKEAFARAIELDSADPLPRLGSGLALVREGALEDGRKEIEIAAVLDPGNALVRSYLGKAYYEEKRDKLAGTQFDLAKALDPRDPTPWFYAAIQHQALNRPVEALSDLQTATTLNQNRAVYRSRLALDQDAAARGVSTARIYNDLGFEQLALVEGYRSVHTDPANHAAHRFLADTFLTQPRSDITRVSELLQSQLLQPLTLNPIQPQLGEDRLFAVRSSGPASAGYNEYNALFTRNRMTLQLEGLAGNRGTQGDQVVFAGIQDRLAWSIGQFDFRSNRFAEANDVKRGVENAFVQIQLAPTTSVQAEYRQSVSDRGDTVGAFDPVNNSVQRSRSETSLLRLGARHVLSPGSTLLLSAMSQRADGTLTVPEFDFFIRDVVRAYGVEAQHLFVRPGWTLVSGMNYYSARADTSSTFFDPTRGKQSHTNLHAYSSWTVVPERLQLCAGFSADDLHEIGFGKQKVNPKIGVSAEIVPGTILRAARFSVLKRQFINNQTLEPTQVAGFSQFFDDLNGTRSTQTGFALDHKFSGQMFAGAALQRRELRVPIPIVELQEFDWREVLQKAYWYWAPSTWLALTAEAHWDRLKRPAELADADQVLEMRTMRVPLGASVFNPFGVQRLAARLVGTHVRQHGTFQTVFAEPVPHATSFWIVDAVLTYRLPARRGFISIEGRNLFDRRPLFQEIDAANPRITGGRLVFGRLVLAF